MVYRVEILIRNEDGDELDGNSVYFELDDEGYAVLSDHLSLMCEQLEELRNSLYV